MDEPRPLQQSLFGERREVGKGCCWGCGRKLAYPIGYVRFGRIRELMYAAVVCSDDCYRKIFRC